ncbi:MAG: hypothetical protein NVSMB38_41270 [Ktedonobacteraceae bacterium]
MLEKVFPSDDEALSPRRATTRREDMMANQEQLAFLMEKHLFNLAYWHIVPQGLV